MQPIEAEIIEMREEGEKVATNCGLFLTEQEAKCKLGHAAQQGAGMIGSGNIAKEERPRKNR